ncbi:hypothetical protein FB451DRAFT_1191917 [Mycena latifolia]|nr:hypothetical protein FB451DRAFT_1191917 [Mycena latifolia]
MGRPKTGKPQGHASAFQGEKLKWLESFAEEFKMTQDRTSFYNKVVKHFLIRYGYDLPFSENVEGDINAWVPVDRKAGLTKEDLEKENDFQEKRQVALCAVRLFDCGVWVKTEMRPQKLSQWYRHRYTGKRIHGGALNKILKTMRVISSAKERPRRKGAVAYYSSKFYTAKMKAEFNAIWEAARTTLPATQRLAMCQDFVNAKWAEESEELRNSIAQEAEEDYVAEMKKYKAEREVAEETAESYHEALEGLDEVGIPLADALTERLGMHVVIMAVGPVGSQKGEVQLRTILSDTSEGQTSKMWGKFDRAGFTAAEASLTRYGRAFFTDTVPAKEQCRARVWPAIKSLDGLLPIDSSEAPTGSATATPTAACGAGAGAALPAGVMPAAGGAVIANEPAGNGGGGIMAAESAGGEDMRGGEGAGSASGNGGSNVSGGGGLEVAIPNASMPPASEASSPVDGIDRWSWSATLINLHKLMSAKEWGPRWQELKDALVAFEESLLHDNGGRLPLSTYRPQEYKDWMQQHRTGEDFVVSEEFGNELLEWWRDIGPKDRAMPCPEGLGEEEEWLLREDPARAWVDWTGLRVRGDNGVILVVLGLMWWGQAIVNKAAGDGLGAGEAALRDEKQWQYMLGDVLWGVREITDEVEPEQRKEKGVGGRESGSQSGRPAEDDGTEEGQKEGRGREGERGKGAEEREDRGEADHRRQKCKGEDEDEPENGKRRRTQNNAVQEPPACPRPKPVARKSKRTVSGTSNADGLPADRPAATPTTGTSAGAMGGEAVGAAAGEVPGPSAGDVEMLEGTLAAVVAGGVNAPQAAGVSGQATGLPAGSGKGAGIGDSEDPFAPQPPSHPFEDDPLAGMSAEEQKDLEEELLADPNAEVDSEDGDDDE